MFSIVRVVIARSEAWHDAGQVRRLRRAGYLDGERQPRRPRHWANR